jgi:hypothetical protein
MYDSRVEVPEFDKRKETPFQLLSVNFGEEKCGVFSARKFKYHTEATSVLDRSFVCLKIKLVNTGDVPGLELSVFPPSMLRIHKLVNDISEIFM